MKGKKSKDPEVERDKYIERLQQGLRKYGRHLPNCQKKAVPPSPNGSGGWEPGYYTNCSCGLDNLLADLGPCPCCGEPLKTPGDCPCGWDDK